MDLETWACPVCLGRLEDDGRVCTAEGRTFPLRDGLPVLLRPEDEGLLKDADAYAAVWRRDELAPPRDAILELPYIASPFWQPKARSLEELLRILGPAQGRRVADAGAGTGWLSYRLTEAGFRCYATDLTADAVVGLGAARAYDSTRNTFERGIASLTRWPFRDSSVDVAVCNASLHYLDDAGPAIKEARRVLSRDGLFVVMNEPVHRDPASAERAAADFRERLRGLGGRGHFVDGYRHFVASDLERALRSVFRDVTRHDPRYGAGFRLSRSAKQAVLRMELASFPIYIARGGSSREDS